MKTLLIMKRLNLQLYEADWKLLERMAAEQKLERIIEFALRTICAVWRSGWPTSATKPERE